jgi:ubiquinone/menaquinone biosynthesis C-methylase UbiE
MNNGTSWENSSDWYSKIVGEKGHYYHQNIISPLLLKILKPKTKETLILDIGCGQGILSRIIPKEFKYTGADLSSSLIQKAKALSKNKNQSFIECDCTQKIPVKESSFDYACFILSIQNMKNQKEAIKNGSLALKPDGKLIIIMNHPCFRIPRQSSWRIDDSKKLQSRQIDCYMSHLEIPLQTHPSQKDKSEVLFSYHYPLSSYTNWLYEEGLVIENMMELISDKASTGTKAKMENRARKEIPLFLVIVANKLRLAKSN